MLYTIDRLARLAGVTTRTLRHYDHIGLLTPNDRTEGNVRLYGRGELERLQAILFYRHLGFPLTDIGAALQKSEAERRVDVAKHLHRLQSERDRIDQMIETVSRTLKENESMKDEELFHGFKQKMVADNEATYGQEVRQRYGTAAAEEANRKWMKLSKAQMDEQVRLAEAILLELKNQTGRVEAASEAGRNLADMHRRWLLFFWPKVEKEGHLGLARMYVEDERFAAYYDKAAPGACQHLLACIEAYYER